MHVSSLMLKALCSLFDPGGCVGIPGHIARRALRYVLLFGHLRPVAGRAVVLRSSLAWASIIPSLCAGDAYGPASLIRACALRLRGVCASIAAVACRSAFP